MTQRNGYRPRRWETHAGQIPLRIPKLQQGSYLHSLLEPRKQSEKSLLAVVREAHVKDVSTRRVDDLGRDGRRSVLGFDVGPGEEKAFWTAFLRRLKERGLTGVLPVTGDLHNGLKKAVQTVLTGAAWQRLRARFMRNLLARILQGNRATVAAALRTIFAQPDREAAGEQLDTVAQALERHRPATAELLWAAAADVLVFMAFPESYRRRIYSTNLLERLNKEVKRRTRVVEIFPNGEPIIRLVGALLVQADEECQLQRRYFSQESMHELYEPQLAQLGKAMPLSLAPVR